MAPKYFWIKERDSSQFGNYFVGMGQLPIKEARALEPKKWSRGNVTIMRRYATKESYEEELSALQARGERVQKQEPSSTNMCPICGFGPMPHFWRVCKVCLKKGAWSAEFVGSSLKISH